jgi:hypothetical protein
MTRKTRLASPDRVRDQSIWHSVSDFLKRVLDIGLAWQYTSLRKQHTRIVGRQFLVCSQGDDSLEVVKLRNTVYSDKQIKELFESMSVEDLPAKVWHAEEIREDAKKAIEQEELLNLGGTYGDKDVGSPVEYDHLKLVTADKTTEITVFNRGITLIFTNDERVRWIHRVLCKLDRTEERLC